MSNGLPGDRHASWLDGFHSGRNWLGLTLRNFLNWEPGTYREPIESKQQLFDGHPETARKATKLITRYSLGHLADTTSRQRYCEILAYLEWLDTAFQTAPDVFNALFKTPEPLNWLDVGAKNWAYAEALYAFIHAYRNANPFRLDGIELDPNRRYINFQTRRQAALSFSSHLSHTQYHEGDVLDWTQSAQIISHFLPFVFKEPLLAWGLPLTHFKPEAILEHELSLLTPGGILFIVNQGEEEAQAQQALLTRSAQRLPIRFQSLGQLPASFIQYRYPRYGWICIKQGI